MPGTEPGKGDAGMNKTSRVLIFMKCSMHKRRCTANEHKILSNYTVISCDVLKEELSPLRGEHTGTRLRSGDHYEEDAIKLGKKELGSGSTVHFSALYSDYLGMTI